jgi:uncharacterized protein YxjI
LGVRRRLHDQGRGGHDRFFVDGKAIALRDTLSFQDAGGRRSPDQEELLSIGSTYEISAGGRTVAVVKKKLFTMFKYRFTVDETATPDPSTSRSRATSSTTSTASPGRAGPWPR